MANHKSALKRARQNAKRRLRNRNLKSTYKSEIKSFITLINENKIDEAKTSLPHLHKTIDKAQTKGVMPKNTASRYKSNLTIRLNRVLSQA
ncbi:MAG: 30S ribosomal protein S20 [Deltaproteobacteria bacterium]|jgi:small subunit ribosomal protein S20|nr:30S ribosomal protein S20 [Deltaproteobacteria bacterium]MBT4525811.1 30S ribosomal protein S20 [Deltaproteobacteria bacterium]